MPPRQKGLGKRLPGPQNTPHVITRQTHVVPAQARFMPSPCLCK
ncbi:hypothetical protein DAQ1742_00579 [Dickeya aquatica]|uniref:Uncharacterized protein n=1 Tax=Dickeya aquatica TaxID=1401087 RepID=A0A375A6Q5_9GAMM|nr:hypothetical protein DAQ1742_00579 [Dickeya aquatica]